MFTPGLVVTSNSLRFLSLPIKTELKRFNLIPEIEMFSHSTPITPRGSCQVACEKNWGSFEVGDRFGSSLGRFWGSFGVAYKPAFPENLVYENSYSSHCSSFIFLILNLIYWKAYFLMEKSWKPALRIFAFKLVFFLLFRESGLTIHAINRFLLCCGSCFYIVNWGQASKI